MLAASTATPYISVIICTRNRGESIRATLSSILANDHPSFDVMVVDQSSNEQTADAVAPLVAVDSRLRYLHVEQPGLSRAYNVGISQTAGEVLAFTDDDCVVPINWLTSILNAFAADPAANLLYGQVLSPEGTYSKGEVTPTLRIPELKRLSRRDGFKVFGMGANFAARRRLFAKIGGFDEMLGGGGPLMSSQDYDLAFRTYRAGSAILLQPDVRVIHHGTRSADEWPATERAYGIGDGAFYFKHVRCHDAFALWLLLRQVLDQSWREAARRLQRRNATNLGYLRWIPEGIRRSTRFGVDRRLRLYVSREL